METIKNLNNLINSSEIIELLNIEEIQQYYGIEFLMKSEPKRE